MDELTQLEKNRLVKAQQMRERGIEPYPNRVNRTHTSSEAVQEYKELESTLGEGEIAEELLVVLAGRLRSIRFMGKIAFAHIEDGDGRIQLFFRANEVDQEGIDQLAQDFDLGDFIEAAGKMMRTRSGEVTLLVTGFRMLAKALTPLPAAKDEIVDGEVIRHAGLTDPETRYRQRYADLAVNEHVRKIFQTRAAIIRSMRKFMEDHGFLEVETPILQPIYGGAAAKPFVTHHNQLKQDLYLRISFELYLKRLLVGGFERVFEIGRDFRNEGVDRTHNPEFTMMEFYWAYADYEDVMRFTEEMVQYIVQEVTGGTRISYQGQVIDFKAPWARMQLKGGLSKLAGIDIDAYPDTEGLRAEMGRRGMNPNPDAPRGKLIENLLSDFIEPKLIQPTLVVDYPRDVSPLAKSQPGDPQTVERFEGFVSGIEICNAFTELNDPQDQLARFEEMANNFGKGEEDRHPMDEDYLRAMRYGMPPNGGFGMGVDRLVMLLTDEPNIREVLLYPHLRKTE